MGFAWRLAVAVVVFAAVGWITDHLVIHHAAQAGSYQPQVRLAAAMAGLFFGGLAATVVGIALALARRAK